MFQRVQDRGQRRADLLLAGRFGDMGRAYLFPLQVYPGSRLIVIGDAAEGIAQAAALHGAGWPCGIVWKTAVIRMRCILRWAQARKKTASTTPTTG